MHARDSTQYARARLQCTERDFQTPVQSTGYLSFYGAERQIGQTPNYACCNFKQRWM